MPKVLGIDKDEAGSNVQYYKEARSTEKFVLMPSQIVDRNQNASINTTSISERKCRLELVDNEVLANCQNSEQIVWGLQEFVNATLQTGQQVQVIEQVRTIGDTKTKLVSL